MLAVANSEHACPHPVANSQIATSPMRGWCYNFTGIYNPLLIAGLGAYEVFLWHLLESTPLPVNSRYT